METSPLSRRSSTIDKRPRPLLFCLLVRIPNARYPSLLGSITHHGHVALCDDSYGTDLRRFVGLVDCGRFALCSIVVLYPGELEGGSLAIRDLIVVTCMMFGAVLLIVQEYVCHKVDKVSHPFAWHTHLSRSSPALSTYHLSFPLI